MLFSCVLFDLPVLLLFWSVGPDVVLCKQLAQRKFHKILRKEMKVCVLWLSVLAIFLLFFFFFSAFFSMCCSLFPTRTKPRVQEVKCSPINGLILALTCATGTKQKKERRKKKRRLVVNWKCSPWVVSRVHHATTKPVWKCWYTVFKLLSAKNSAKKTPYNVENKVLLD